MAETYAGYFPLDVFQEMLLASDEVRVLEFGIVFLWLHQSSLLNMHNLSKAI